MSIAKSIRSKVGKKSKTNDWYVNQLSEELTKYQQVDSDEFDTGGLSEGNLYFFRYTPQKPRKNEVYDLNPLAFILEIRGDRLLAVNFHHAQPQIRKILAKSLLNKLDVTSIPRNCYRTYYLAGCSNFQKVPEKFWEEVSDLPTEKFYSSNTLIHSSKGWEHKS